MSSIDLSEACIETAPAPSNRPTPPPLPVNPAAKLPEGAQVYRTEGQALSFGEWWRLTRNWQVLFCWGIKLLRLDTLSKGRALLIPDYRVLLAPLEQLPQAGRDRVISRLQEFAPLGFEQPCFLHFVNPFDNVELAIGQAFHPAAGTVVRVMWSASLNAAKVKPIFCAALLSAAPGGRFFATGDRKRTFKTPREVTATALPGASAEELLEAHWRAVEKSGESLLPTSCADGAWKAVNDYENACASFGIARGHYVPRTAAEAAEDDARLSFGRSVSAGNERISQAARELEKQRTSRGGRWSGLMLLAVTLIASTLAGGLKWSWLAGGMILAVLAFHELGHYVAMRCFRYRNVRMFFIPILGAAVTGRNHNVPGWKRALVSLAGPLPGILVSVPLCIAAVWKDQPELGFAAMMLAAINGFNLLPLPPLDGGHFWNELLFARHRWAEAAFKALAGLALIGAFAAGHGRLWVYLGGVMLLRVPQILLVGRVAKRLRARGVESAAADDDAVPPGTACAILEELDAETKGKLNPSKLAGLGLRTFEQLNAKPPGWLEGFGLFAMYALGVVVAAVVFVAAVTGMHGNKRFEQTLAAAGSRRAQAPAVPEAPEPPKPQANADTPIEADDIELISARQETENPQPRHIVLKFANASAASAAFANAQSELLPSEELMRLGATLVLYSPSRKSGHPAALAEKLKPLGADAVYDSGRPGAYPYMDLACEMEEPAAATRLKEDLSAWMLLSFDRHPAAPWTFPPEEEALMFRACRTYEAVRVAKADAWQSPEVREASRKLRGNLLLSLFGSRDRTKRLAAVNEARTQAQRRAIQGLIDRHDASLEERVLAHALNEPSWVNSPSEREKWRKEMLPLLHIDAAEEGAVDDYEPPAVTGTCTAEGTEVAFIRLNFVRATRDLAPFIKYLSARGCRNLRADWHASEDPLDEEE